MLLAKVNKWKGKNIDKEEKLSKAIHELNDKLRCFKELSEAQRELEDEVGSYRHELYDAKEMYACD